MHNNSPEFKDINNQQEKSENELMKSAVKEALSCLANNGDAGKLQLFIHKYGEQQEPIQLGSHSERNLENILDYTLKIIAQENNFNYSLNIWDILKKSGVLQANRLAKVIDSYITDKMSFSPEEAMNIKNNLGIEVKTYTPDELEKFKSDIKDKVVETLSWNI